MREFVHSKSLHKQLIIVIFTLIPAGLIIRSFVYRAWLPLLLIPVMLLGFHYHQRLVTHWRAMLVGLMLALILIFSLNGVRIMRSNVVHPPEWDFLDFWLSGRVAAQGLNFYLPEYYQEAAQNFNLSDEFSQEVLEVGFKYPPPTIFLFLPLGLFDLQTAYLIWYVVNGAILILDIFFLWKLFLKRSGLIGLLMTTSLVFMLRPTLSTIGYGQTNFIVLLMFLLFWQNRKNLWGGIWLALGIFIKPLFALLLMYPLLQRHWRTLFVTFVMMAVVSTLTIIVFGTPTFFDYFTASSVSQVPGYVYTEMVNQSLLATTLRLTEYDFSETSPLTHPIFIILAFILTGITGWLVYALDESYADWALVLVLSLALLIYPATLEHYSVLLIVPLLLLWKYRQEFTSGVWSITAFISLTYVLVSYRGGNFVFVANALNWFVSTGVGIWLLMQRTKQLDTFERYVSAE